jgi:hypothetical protein
MVHREAPIEAALYLGTSIVVVTGSVVWGARLPDFNTLHLFFGGIVIIGTPAAAVAVWSIWKQLRGKGYRLLALTVIALCILQLELGVGLGIDRLQVFGPGTYPPVPLQTLAHIEGLPVDAKLAYACRIDEETAFWDARLLGISAHTGRRLVPMCFEAETLGVLTGGRFDTDVESPLFRLAPQRALYPESSARPSEASVVAFLKANGIGYIYADRLHPNSLVPGATSINSSGDAEVFQVP